MLLSVRLTLCRQSACVRVGADTRAAIANGASRASRAHVRGHSPATSHGWPDSCEPACARTLQHWRRRLEPSMHHFLFSPQRRPLRLYLLGLALIFAGAWAMGEYRIDAADGARLVGRTDAECAVAAPADPARDATGGLEAALTSAVASSAARRAARATCRAPAPAVGPRPQSASRRDDPGPRPTPVLAVRRCDHPCCRHTGARRMSRAVPGCPVRTDGGPPRLAHRPLQHSGALQWTTTSRW